MDWIKRNLPFVVGIVAALVFIVGGVFYLLGQMERASTATNDLANDNQRLDELVGHDPYPDAKSIDAAKAEQVKLRQFQGRALGMFQTNNAPKDLDSERFQQLLLGTLAELERAAVDAGTKLPSSDYAFTFSPIKGNTLIPASRLGEFAAQIGDVRAISRILFLSKIHSLSHLKRAGTSTNDNGSPDILAGKKTLTDPATGAVQRQYEVQFQSFSSELGSVLSGFANAPETIIIRALNVQRGNLVADVGVAQAAMAAPVMIGGSRMDPLLAQRYGLGGNRALPQPQAPTATRPGDPVADEKPLQVTMLLEVVKLAAPNVNPSAGGGKATAASARIAAPVAN